MPYNSLPSSSPPSVSFKGHKVRMYSILASANPSISNQNQGTTIKEGEGGRSIRHGSICTCIQRTPFPQGQTLAHRHIDECMQCHYTHIFHNPRPSNIHAVSASTSYTERKSVFPPTPGFFIHNIARGKGFHFWISFFLFPLLLALLPLIPPLPPSLHSIPYINTPVYVLLPPM